MNCRNRIVFHIPADILGYRNENHKKRKEGKVMEERKGRGLNWTGILIALIAGVTAIICAVVLSGNLVQYKKTSGSGGLSATGSATCDFESDLVVWRGSFSVYGEDTADAYAVIKEDARLVKEYLLANGVTEEEKVFSSVDISQQ